MKPGGCAAVIVEPSGHQLPEANLSLLSTPRSLVSVVSDHLRLSSSQVLQIAHALVSVYTVPVSDERDQSPLRIRGEFMRHSSKQIEDLNRRVADFQRQLADLEAAIQGLPEPQQRELLKVFRETERALAVLRAHCS